MSITSLEHDGMTMRVHPAAPGRPSVLFLNGVFGGGWIWEAVVAALVDNGYGATVFDEPLAAHNNADDLDALSDSLALVCETLPDPAPVLCANSLGALAAMELAVRHPARWPGLILAGPGGLGRAQDIAGFGSVLRTPNLKLGYLLANRIFHRKELITPSLIERCTESLSVRMLIRAGRALRATRDYDARPLLPQIQAPTLLLCGQYDEVSPAALWRQASADLRAGQFVEIPNSGHSPMLEEPQVFVEALLHWLASLPVQR